MAGKVRALLPVVVAMIPCVAMAVSPPKQKPQTEEQKAASHQASLESQALALDHECKPSVARRAVLAAAPVAASRFFWSGQRYAVAREVRNQVAAVRARKISAETDRQIGAIESRRDAALGIRPAPVDPGVAKAMADAQRTIEETDALLVRSAYEWAERCNKVIDERLRAIDAAQ